MQLETYISELLYRYECVTVPEFGAFLSHQIPAKLDTTSQVLYPPSKRLSFNRQLSKNDGLLCNYISQAEEISYPDALKKVHAYSEYLNSTLEQVKTLHLVGLGALQNNDSKISFEPETTINYLTTSFGLDSIGVTPVMREVYKSQAESIEENTPLLITTEKRSLPVWVRYAAIGLIAIGVSGLLGYRHVKNVEAYNVAAKQEAETLLQNKIQAATFTISNPLPAIHLKASKPNGKYHIIAGAFRVAENAEKKVAQLRAKGYKSRQIGQNKYGLHQVVYGSFTEASQALEVLRSVRKNDDREAWMLIQELD